MPFAGCRVQDLVLVISLHQFIFRASVHLRKQRWQQLGDQRPVRVGGGVREREREKGRKEERGRGVGEGEGKVGGASLR